MPTTTPPSHDFAPHHVARGVGMSVQPSPSFILLSSQVQDGVVESASRVACDLLEHKCVHVFEIYEKASELHDVAHDVALTGPGDSAAFLLRLLTETDSVVLTNLRPSVLHNLAGNTAISSTCPDLTKKITETLARTESVNSERSFDQSSTAYRPDFDGRSGFLSEKSFVAFKKQRDGLYRLLQQWKDSQCNPDFLKERTFFYAVTNLFALANDAENHHHLADLLVRQFLADLKREDYDAESPQKKTSAARLRLLEERMTAPRAEFDELRLDSSLAFYEAFVAADASGGFREALTGVVAGYIDELVYKDSLSSSPSASESH